MAFLTVNDPADVRLDEYRNIPDADLLLGRGIFVAEGRMVVRRLLSESPLSTRSVMVTSAACAALADVFAARPEIPIYVVPQPLMDGIAGFNIHRGCLAIGERPPSARWHEVAGAARTIVALERVGNADNVGGIFRNAAAFGAGTVILDSASADPLYRKAIRTSMGAALLLPFARDGQWPAALQELRTAGVTLIAMTPSATSSLQACADALAGRHVGIVLGHEGEGLSDAALAQCDYRARIPMTAGVDSVNVATAAAIALYELRRDRA